MGIFPLEFACGEHALALDGTETLRLHGLNDLTPGTTSVAMEIARADGTTDRMTLRLRLDTGNEVAYLRHGGTLPYVIRRTLANT